MPATAACSDGWLTFQATSLWIPLPIIQNSRVHWQKTQSYSRSCRWWKDKHPIIGRRKARQRWSLSFNGKMKSFLSRWRPRIASVEEASRCTTKNTIQKAASVSLFSTYSVMATCLVVLRLWPSGVGNGYNKKPLLMGKKEGKNNIKIMKKIRRYFFSMLSHRKLMQR